jgi:hypothetical protein
MQIFCSARYKQRAADDFADSALGGFDPLVAAGPPFLPGVSAFGEARQEVTSGDWSHL